MHCYSEQWITLIYSSWCLKGHLCAAVITLNWLFNIQQTVYNIHSHIESSGTVEVIQSQHVLNMTSSPLSEPWYWYWKRQTDRQGHLQTDSEPLFLCNLQSVSVIHVSNHKRETDQGWCVLHQTSFKVTMKSLFFFIFYIFIFSVAHHNHPINSSRTKSSPTFVLVCKAVWLRYVIIGKKRRNFFHAESSLSTDLSSFCIYDL